MRKFQKFDKQCLIVFPRPKASKMFLVILLEWLAHKVNSRGISKKRTRFLFEQKDFQEISVKMNQIDGISFLRA